MIYPSQYPENGCLIEWSEQQQTFFANEISDHKLDKQTNMHGVVPVATCNSLDEALLIISFVEDLLKKRGALAYEKEATTKEVELFIKKLLVFSDKHARFLKKKKSA